MYENIEVKRLISSLEHYVAEADPTKHGRVNTLLRGEEFVLSLSHNDILSKDSIVGLRHLLEK